MAKAIDSQLRSLQVVSPGGGSHPHQPQSDMRPARMATKEPGYATNTEDPLAQSSGDAATGIDFHRPNGQKSPDDASRVLQAMQHVPRKKTADLPSYEYDSKVLPQSEAVYLHAGDLYHQEEDLAFESRQQLVASNEFEAFKQQ